MPTKQTIEYIENQKNIFFKKIPNFINQKTSFEKLEHVNNEVSLNVFHELEILITLYDYLDEYNLSVHPSENKSKDDIKKLIFDYLSHGFKYLDENGFVAGYDIDGKASATNFHFFANQVAINAFETLGRDYDSGLMSYITRIKNGAFKAAKTIKEYANYEIKAYRGLNLIFMDISTLIKAGEYFHKPEWVEIGEAASKRLISRFDKDEGYLPDFRDENENPGPSSSYALYSIFTCSYFAQVRPTDQLAEKLKSFLNWIFKILYPNGQPIEIFDERGRQYPGNSKSTFAFSIKDRAPFFAFCKAGRDAISLQSLIPEIKIPLDVISSELYLYKKIIEKNPTFIDILDSSDSIWHTRKAEYFYTYKNNKSSVLKNQNWILSSHGFLSGQINPKHMWHRELQQHVGTYFHGIGSILGGGNSLGQPEFSTLRTDQSYLCDDVTVISTDSKQQLTQLTNGGWQINLSQSVLNEFEISIKCEILRNDSHQNAYLQFPIACYSSRQKLTSGNKTITSFENIKTSEILNEPILILGSLNDQPYSITLSSNHQVNTTWPVLPVDIRTPGIPNLPLEHAVMVLMFNLSEVISPIEIQMKVNWL